MKTRALLRLSLIILALPLGTAHAWRIRTNIGDSWNQTSIIAIGKPIPAAQPTDAGQEYSCIVKYALKGAQTGQTINFVNTRPRSEDSIYFTENQLHLLLILTPQDQKRMSRSQNAETPNFNRVREAYSISDTNIPVVQDAAASRAKFETIEDEEVKKLFLIEEIQKENPFVRNFYTREVLIGQYPETIPYFRMQLEDAQSPDEKLDAAGCLRIVGDLAIKEIVISWLHQPEFEENRYAVISEMTRFKDTSMSTHLRPLINDEDEVVAAAARIALYNMSEEDGTSLLIDTLKTFTNDSARINSMSRLHWGWRRGFRDAEKTYIVSLMHDEHEGVARFAALLAKKWDVSQKNSEK